MSTTKDQRPDILLIMPDQMRGDCLSLEGHPVLQTPNIDDLGLRGMHFTRAYTTCPSCIPARRAMLSALHPASPGNGMTGFRERHELHAPVFPQLLHDGGYHTTIVGRHMHQFPYDKPYGFADRTYATAYKDDDEYAQEFEAAFPGQGGLKSHGLSSNGQTVKPWQFPDAWHPTTWIANRARQKLAAAPDDRPHFLTASFFAPHPPLLPPACYYERYLAMDLPPRALGDWTVPPDERFWLRFWRSHIERNRIDLDGARLHQARAGYYGLINHIDDQVFAMCFEFRRQCARRGRPGVIVFTTDHGEMLADHYLWHKCEPYEASSRIPFLIQGTDDLGFVRGARHDAPVCLEDIGPTLLELAGLAPMENVDGRSLVPILRGLGGPVREIIHGEHATAYDEHQAFQMLTDGRMKYIWRPHSGAEQLFDLTTDPQECINLAAKPEHATEVSRWRDRLIAQLQNRPEGFVSEGKLVAGQPYPDLVPAD